MLSTNVFTSKRLHCKAWTIHLRCSGWTAQMISVTTSIFLESSFELLKRIVRLQHRCEDIWKPWYFNARFQMTQECFHPSSEMSLHIEHAMSCLIDCSYVQHFVYIQNTSLILQQRYWCKDQICSTAMLLLQKS